MTSSLILINGLPASGKTSLAEDIAFRLGWPLLSKDAVKEALADLTGPAVPAERLGRIAMDTLWSVAGAADIGMVIESFWWKHRDLRHVERGLEAAGSPAVVEVWCAVPADVAAERYEDRDRHPVHTPGWELSEHPEWEKHPPEPLAVGPVVHVDTADEYDLDAVLAEIGAGLGGVELPR
ncbi:AAA family ATPase [Lysobacter korlensis]|uniref:AAA family ATPase n=1 Tax=Lysobacter korlensis TaxID=553636 RepID=A0ABV6RV78_9GAMM